jgi:hypothetical protein
LWLSALLPAVQARACLQVLHDAACETRDAHRDTHHQPTHHQPGHHQRGQQSGAQQRAGQPPVVPLVGGDQPVGGDAPGGGCGDPGSCVTLEQLRADLLVRFLLTATTADTASADTASLSTAPPGTAPADTGSADTASADTASLSTASSGAAPRETALPGVGVGLRPLVSVLVAASTLLGQDEAPGWLDGYGPVTAETARELAHDPSGTWRRLLIDPVDGRPLDYGTRRYRPPPHLHEHVVARDGHCTFPTCTHPARSCDLDHAQDFPHGRTSAANLHAAHRRHHNAKTHGGWRVHRDPATNTTTWTSPQHRAYPSTPTPRWDPPGPNPPGTNPPGTNPPPTPTADDCPF